MKEYNRDEFWKIDKLVPKKNSGLKTFSTKAKTVEYSVPSEPRTESDRFKLTLTDGVAVSRDDLCYKPKTGLIKSVTVRHTPDKFDFHIGFLRAAHLYFNFKGAKCEFAPYYSYMPQYTQLNEAQKNYYFYWRTMVRSGEYIKTDYSYLYLYVYEIINLPDLILPKDGIKILARLWRAYRKQLPNIDSNFALWIEDYCLVYNVECPMDELSDFLFMNPNIPFKEFYLSDTETLGAAGVSSMISYLSDYDWRSGKYAGGDNKEAYAKHMLGSMSIFISEMLVDGKILSTIGNVATLDRQAFKGALLSSGTKCRIICTYRPISEDSELRMTVTSLVKYTENKLRALLSVKSRLAVKPVPTEYTAMIDGYFSELFAKVNRERARATRPEYERFYESDSVGISSSDADEIERASWTTTARLVEDIEEYSEPVVYEAQPVPEKGKDEAAEARAESTFGLSSDMIEFVRAALRSDFERQARIADKLGELADSIADSINEAFSDGFGDVILECLGDGYTIIDDYKEDIEEWLLKTVG